jgi:predicted dehydrogenase
MGADTPDPRRFLPPRRRLRLGFVGGGRGAFIGEVHANGARLSNRFEIVAGALSADPETARQSGKDWLLPADRIYADYGEMAEREAARSDAIDAVAITTPNNTHHAIAAAFMDRGIDVICDKPLTSTLDDALDLVARQRRSGVIFAVTYSFAAHAMVRQAREMVRDGAVGRIRQIHVEYFQDWAINPPPASAKGAQWRVDRSRVGAAFTTNDIGTHAHHLASFVTGLPLERVRADFHVSGYPKSLEDTAFMHLRFAGDVPGTLMVSQAAAGTQCGLRLRVFGDLAGIEWEQENPEYLRYNRVDEPSQTISRGFGAGMGIAASRLVRMPRGHPEALTDAWANLYTEFAIAVEARRAGETVPEGLLAYPTVMDGALGVKFVQAAVASNAAGGTWMDCCLS